METLFGRGIHMGGIFDAASSEESRVVNNCMSAWEFQWITKPYALLHNSAQVR